MKPNLLDAGRLPPALLARLAADCEPTTLARPPDAAAHLPAHLPAHLAAHGAGWAALVASAAIGADAAPIAALRDRRIAGAGLDVFESEPQVPAELMALDNVALLPQLASAMRETRQAMADRVLDNLQCFFATGRLLSAAAAASLEVRSS